MIGRPRIRNMIEADVGQVGNILFRAFNEVSLKHGYGQRLHNETVGKTWAWKLLHSQQSRLVVAELGNRIVGISCLNPRGRVANLGPVAVDPDYQGNAIGSELIRTLLKEADGIESIRVVQESFNPASFCLYYFNNFLPVASVLELSLNEKAEQETGNESNVSDLTGKDLDEVCSYDYSKSNFDRSTDLAYYLRWGKIFAYRKNKQIHGFMAGLPGAEFVQLGPMLSEGEAEAVCLFRYAIGLFKGRKFRTRVMAKDHALVGTLINLGFKLHSANNLMVRGPWRPAAYAQAIGIFPDGA